MANVHSAGQTIHEESRQPAVVVEVGAVEAPAGVRRIQGAVSVDVDDGDRWDGLS
jgi:hypothetical protein